MRRADLLASLLLLAACGAPSARPATTKANQGAPALSRAEWLAAVAGYAADPSTLPRRSDSEGRARFDALLNLDVWASVGATDFVEAAPDIAAFQQGLRQLAMSAVSAQAHDEFMRIGLFMHESHPPLFAAMATHLATLSPEDQAKRRGGIDKMQVGAAEVVCGVLHDLAAGVGDSDTRMMIAQDLAEASSYRHMGREALQLVLATIDERILPSNPAATPMLAPVRSVIATEFAARPPAPGPVRTIYEAFGAPTFETSPTLVAVSHTGEFSVAMGALALIARVATTQADGRVTVMHRIAYEIGGTTFSAICMNGVTAQQWLTAFGQQPGACTVMSTLPGAWLTIATAELFGAFRFLDVGSRGCLASVEGPPGAVPPGTIDAFLGSLRAYP